MTQQPMNETHQKTAPWVWQLSDRGATTLAAQPTPRWLQVEDGQLWVTAQQAGAHAPDLWLGAGDRLELPAGSAWVLQAWPQARMSLLAPPVLKPASASSGQWAKPARPPTRAWWQSTWFWPWVLPATPGQRRALPG